MYFMYVCSYICARELYVCGYDFVTFPVCEIILCVWFSAEKFQVEGFITSAE